MRGRIANALPALAWMTLIFTMSSRSQVPQPFGFSAYLLAIAAHLFLYGVLALLLLRALDPNGEPSTKTRLAAIAVAVLYGISDEFHQSFVPGRDASLFDIVVNTTGAALSVIVWTRLRPLVPQSRLD